MTSRKAWLQGDICYRTGLQWRQILLIADHGQGNQGHHLKEIKFQFSDDQVKVILKKQGPHGAQVAFLSAETVDQALWALSLSMKAKQLKWYADRYAAYRFDNT